ncbi:MAG TPA: hypothetical protein PKA64_25740, partial [Myxococcota bacterium]|nr:hypothetical protein [Myxococcota bacterium]
LRQAARDEAERRRGDLASQRAATLEEFDEAYDEARLSYAGLPELDRLRAQFDELVRLAEGAESAGARATNTRFQAIDARLPMGSLTDAEIDEMPQWSHIGDELESLESELDTSAGDVDWDDVREHQDNLARMFENARYRLQPGGGQGGPVRTMLPAGPARTRYETLLRAVEGRWATANRKALGFMASEEQTVVDSYPAGAARPERSPPLPAGAPLVDQLVEATRRYDGLLRVQPNLPADLTPAALYRDFISAGVRYSAFVRSNSRYSDGLDRLRAAESILTELRTRTRAEPTPDDPVVRQARLAAIARSQEVVDARRVDWGYLYPDEADSLLGGGQATTDPTIRSLAQSAAPLTPHESFALGTGDLGDVHLSGTGNRLDLRPDLIPWAREHVHQLRRFVGTWDEVDLFILSAGGVRITAADNVIVGLTGAAQDTTSGRYGHTQELQVVALSNRARLVLGAAPVWIEAPELETIQAEELAGP